MKPIKRLLILVRHGDAAGPEAKPGGDRARPLTEFGRREVGTLAAQMSAAKLKPAHGVTSPAARVLETAAILARDLGVAGDAWGADETLYDPGSLAAARTAAASLPDEAAQVVVVGHNPTLSVLASRLSGRDVALGTAEAAVLAAESDSWAAALSPEADGTWRLEGHLTPY
jgi:phosphohistidine phosphatase